MLALPKLYYGAKYTMNFECFFYTYIDAELVFVPHFQYNFYVMFLSFYSNYKFLSISSDLSIVRCQQSS